MKEDPGIGFKLGQEAPATPCFRCGECCSRYQVLIDEGEARCISEYLGIRPEKLKEDYTDIRWPVPGRYLLRHRDSGCCIFLVHKGREALCSVHFVKPKACRDWTASLDRRECRDGLARQWGLSLNDGGALVGPEEQQHRFRQFVKSLTE